MKKNTQLILKVMQVVTWIVFIGACIKTGAIIYSFFVSFFINPVASKDLYMGLNLSELMQYNMQYYVSLALFIIFLAGLRAYITYLVIKIFLKINFVHPFSIEVASLIKNISYVALGIGMLTLTGIAYSNWLMKRGVALNNLHEYLEGSTEFIFMGGIVFIIAQIFKRGIEIQSENELTI